MADILGRTTASPTGQEQQVPADGFRGLDQELDEMFGGGQPTPQLPQAAPGPVPQGPQVQSAPAAEYYPQQAYQQPTDLQSVPADDAVFDQELESVFGAPEQVEPQAPAEQPAYFSGLERGIVQVQQTPFALLGTYAETQGDLRGMLAMGGQIDRLNKTMPPQQMPTLAQVKKPGDLSVWLLERLGEQTPIFLSMGLTGGAGAYAGRLTAKSLLMSEASKKALTRYGAYGGGLTGAAALETAGTASELYEATGSFNPELSVVAGLAKSGLEFYTPFKLLKDFGSKEMMGRLAKAPFSTIGKETLRTAAREGATEFPQEIIDVTARELADPNFQLYSRETGIRVVEAGLTGFFVGGTVGGPTTAIQAPFAKRAASVPPPPKPGPGAPSTKLKAGTERTLTPDEIASLPTEAEPGIKEDSPVAWLNRKQKNREDIVTVNPDVTPPAIIDFLEVAPIVAEINRNINRPIGDSQQVRNETLLDANTPRYAIQNEKGGYGNEMLNGTELEERLARLSNDAPRPKIVEINQDSLVPGMITAVLRDLPLDPADNRIYFLPDTPQEVKEQVLQRYGALVPRLEEYRQALFNSENRGALEEVRQSLEGEYVALLQNGIRIIPSAGTSFNYNGVAQGSPINYTPASSRSVHVAYVKNINDVTKGRVFNNYGIDLARPNTIAVAIDLSQVKPEQIRDPENRKEQVDPATAEAFIIEGDIPPGAIVTATEQIQERFRSVPGSQEAYQREVAIDRSGEESLVTRVESEDFEVQVWGDGIADSIQKVEPIIRSLLKRLGFKKMPEIRVDDTLDRKSAQYDSNLNLLTIPTQRYVDGYGQITGNLDLDIFMMLLHEIGHLVTLRPWYQLPAGVQREVKMGYERALLKARVEGQLEHMNVPWRGLTAKQASPRHGFMFEEYLAEQFRRWAISDAQVLSDVDKFHKGVANQLEKTVKLALKKMGKERANNLYASNFSFYEMMSYIEAAAEDNVELIKMSSEKVGEINEAFESLPGDPFVRYREMVAKELQELRNLLAEDIKVEVSDQLNYDPLTMQITRGQFNAATRTLQIFVGSLISMGDTNRDISGTVAHELWHSIEKNIPQEYITILARRAKREKLMSGALLLNYTKNLRSQLEAFKTPSGAQLPASMIERLLQEAVNREYAARLVERRRGGASFDTIVDRILDRIIQTAERIKNMLLGLGFTSVDDVIGQFYRGELTKRHNEAEQTKKNVLGRKILQKQVDSFDPTDFGEIAEADNLGLYVTRTKGDLRDAAVADSVEKSHDGQYFFFVIPDEFKPDNFVPIGVLAIEFTDDVRGYYVHDVKVEEEWRGVQPNGTKFARRMYEYIERKTGRPLLVSGTLLPDGYEMHQKRNPEVVRDYQYDPKDEMWMSPNYLRGRIKLLRDLIKDHEAMDKPPKHVLRGLKGQQKHYEMLLLQSGNALNSEPDYTRYMRQEMTLAQVEKAREIEDAQVVDAITGEEIGPISSDFEEVYKGKQELSKISNAEKLGVDVEVSAPEINFVSNSMDIIDWAYRGGRVGGRDPNIARHLRPQPSLQAEADRIGWFSELFYSLHQIAWRNEHIAGLRRYVQFVEQWNTKIMHWVSRSDETARAWNKIADADERDNLTELLFWATEMNYRTPAEVAARVLRYPTAAELAAETNRLGLSPDTVNLYHQIDGDFRAFLDEVERIAIRNAHRTFAANPTGLANALNNIAREHAALKARPYFPMVRFGEYTITVRDPHASNAVVAFYAYPTRRERDGSVQQVAAQWPGDDISIGLLPQEVHEFLGLPAHMLRTIKSQLPGLTPSQARWLDQLEHLNAPEKSFAKRWLRRKGTPGYSMDGIRTYAHYFRSASRYLARLEYKDDMQDAVTLVRDQAHQLNDDERRGRIADYMQSHHNYIMEGGRDWGKLKSFVSVWMLGGSVAAAGMNLTQVPMATFPFMAGIFGPGKSLNILRKNANVLRQTFGLPGVGTTPDYIKAREEAIAQGRIATGQAVELGAFAEYDNLDRTYAGTSAQRIWRKFGYWAMLMFSTSEQFNREWAFKSAYDLALSENNHPWVQKLNQHNITEILDIAARTGLTHQQATAFVAARHIVDQTQFIYQPYARPKFLRGGFASTLQVFFSYTQAMLYLMGSSPGQKLMWAMMLGMYGVSGLPGSDDLDEIIRLIFRKVFGADFSPHHEMRKAVRDLTEGSIFDQVGPDLVLHGISRYGFGIGLLPEGYGAPRFDASLNGSMGKIVPGLHEAARAFSNSRDWKEFTAEVTRDVSGAGFGQFFSLLQFLSSDPWSADMKKWEKIMPRAAKAAAKAIRYGTEGQERSNTGAQFAEFDMTDPDDVATVITQFLGFTPTKISEKWEMINATKDLTEWYEARKLFLYNQMNEAIMRNSTKDIQRVVSSINAYNEELQRMGIPDLGIKGKTLQSSMKARHKNRQKQELGLPLKKSEYLLNEQLKHLYPGVKWPSVPASSRVK